MSIGERVTILIGICFLTLVAAVFVADWMER